MGSPAVAVVFALFGVESCCADGRDLVVDLCGVLKWDESVLGNVDCSFPFAWLGNDAPLTRSVPPVLSFCKLCPLLVFTMSCTGSVGLSVALTAENCRVF